MYARWWVGKSRCNVLSLMRLSDDRQDKNQSCGVPNIVDTMARSETETRVRQHTGVRPVNDQGHAMQTSGSFTRTFPAPVGCTAPSRFDTPNSRQVSGGAGQFATWRSRRSMMEMLVVTRA